ncbi:MAG TPA: hypothetical protein VL522_09135 [Bordetella sp.]|nr:hypothetical protein [Bordetella sp.]
MPSAPHGHPGQEWAANFATYRVRRGAEGARQVDDDSLAIHNGSDIDIEIKPSVAANENQIEPIPDVERPLTTINDITSLPQREGAYAQTINCRWVRGKWLTAGPCERARPYYEAWKAAPDGSDAAEFFYDALFFELANTSRFLRMVDRTIADWKNSGRLARGIELRQLIYPELDVRMAEERIREDLMVWRPPAGVRLDQRCAWNLLGEVDHRARRLAATRPVFEGWSLQAVAMEWQLWHEGNVRKAAARGERFDANREARVLNKMLILKQLLDVELAVEMAYKRELAKRRAAEGFFDGTAQNA